MSPMQNKWTVNNEKSKIWSHDANWPLPYAVNKIIELSNFTGKNMVMTLIFILQGITKISVLKISERDFSIPASSCSCVTSASSWLFSRFAFSHSSRADTASLLNVLQSWAKVWTSPRSDSTIFSMSDTLCKREVCESSKLDRRSLSLLNSSLSYKTQNHLGSGVLTIDYKRSLMEIFKWCDDQYYGEYVWSIIIGN